MFKIEGRMHDGQIIKHFCPTREQANQAWTELILDGGLACASYYEVLREFNWRENTLELPANPKASHDSPISR